MSETSLWPCKKPGCHSRFLAASQLFVPEPHDVVRQERGIHDKTTMPTKEELVRHGHCFSHKKPSFISLEQTLQWMERFRVNLEIKRLEYASKHDLEKEERAAQRLVKKLKRQIDPPSLPVVQSRPKNYGECRPPIVKAAKVEKNDNKKNRKRH